MSDEPAVLSKGVVLYLHYDQQGSTRMLTSTTGVTEATITYDAYGNFAGATRGTPVTIQGLLDASVAKHSG